MYMMGLLAAWAQMLTSKSWASENGVNERGERQKKEC
jgi:hypothetical protein